MKKKFNMTIVLVLFFIVVISWLVVSDSIKARNDYIYSNKDNNTSDYTSLLFVGDIMIGRNVANNPFEFVNILINSTDLSFGNLEYSITNRTIPVDKIYKREKKTSSLKVDCGTSQELKNVGFDELSLANNHVMDFGEMGLEDTMRCLDNLGMYYTGAGTNTSNAKRLIIVNENGLNIGFLSYTSVSPSNAYAKNNRSGVSLIGDDVYDDIHEARSKVDFLIIYTHWGNEFELTPDDTQEDKGRRMIDAGADIVIGSHPHVIQPFERYKGKYIFYSLGNFVFDQEHEVTKNSVAIRAFLDKNGSIAKIEKINLRSEYTKPYILNKETIDERLK